MHIMLLVLGGHGSGGSGGGGNGGNGGAGSTSLLAADKDEKRKLPPVTITLVSFAVSRKAYTRVMTSFTEQVDLSVVCIRSERLHV